MSGGAVMLMIWVFGAGIAEAFDKQLGQIGGFVVLIGGIVGAKTGWRLIRLN